MQISERLRKLLFEKKEKIRTACPKCNGQGCYLCASMFEVYYNMAKANVPIKFWDAKVGDLHLCPSANKKVTAYIAKMKEAKDKGIGLYCCGASGLGKSLSVAIILKYALKKGYKVRFSTLGEILAMSSDGTYDRKNRKEFRREILEVDFLVIDDIDKAFKSQKSSFHDAAIDQMFRARANECLPTIITANKPREESIEKIGNSFVKALLDLFDEHLLDIVFRAPTGSKRREIQDKNVEKFWSKSE